MLQNHKSILIQRASIIAAICGAMIAIHIADWLLGGWLKSFGIHPREISSVYTIATAPWLHADFTHLFSNLSAFVVLAALSLINGIRYFAKASLLIMAIGGALVWLLGRGSIHIGASGWIFGLWSLSIALAWYQRSYRNAVIAILVLLFYGGMIFGLLPTTGYISFESHLFGAIAGVVAASILSKKPQPISAPVEKRVNELKFWS
ncbi:MAG: rhomboid family intramembrane serine protease [Sphingorhabdus sp.]